MPELTGSGDLEEARSRVCQAESESIRDDALPITTRVVIVGGMKGPMEVADQMQNEFQRDEPFFWIGAGGQRVRR